MTLVGRIKMVAKQQGVSLKVLATRAGLAENAIYRWDTNNPRSENLQKVADILSVSVDYLLGNTNEKKPASKDAGREVNIDDNTVILKFNGIELDDEYRQYIIDDIKKLRKLRGQD